MELNSTTEKTDGMGQDRWIPLLSPSSTTPGVVLIWSTSQGNIPVTWPDVPLKNLSWSSSQCDDRSHFIPLHVFPLLAFLFTYTARLDLNSTKKQKQTHKHTHTHTHTQKLYLYLGSAFYKTWPTTTGTGSGPRHRCSSWELGVKLLICIKPTETI